MPAASKIFVVVSSEIHDSTAQREALSSSLTRLNCGPIQAFHDSPSVSGRLGLVNDESSRCALASRFLELIGPATVVSHGAAVEDIRILGGESGIVDQHHDRLALDVDPFVVVPVVLGSDDTVTDVDHFRSVETDLVLDLKGPAHKLVAVGKGQG